MEKLYWKIRKIFQPNLVNRRNCYIKGTIRMAGQYKEDLGTFQFEQRFGKNYIEEMRKDLI